MRSFLLTLLFLVCSLGCEDVIDVETPSTEPRLVINGLIRVDRDQEFLPVKIRVTETSNFFDQIPVTQLDNALIMYGTPLPDAPELFDSIAFSNLAESEPGSGIYEPDPTFDTEQRIRNSFVDSTTVFILIVENKGRRYLARTPFSPTVPIESLQQDELEVFNETLTGVKVKITDTPDIKNHYVMDFGNAEFETLDDQFFDGQEFEFSYFYDDDNTPEKGQETEISILGADEQLYNYMNLLLEQTEETGGVFETPATTVRGNILDATGIDNNNLFDNSGRPNEYALGYFAVVQEYRKKIIFE
ncbi:MAG: DUF4249 family protein [Flavobacteriaceae bacterium]